MKAIFGVGKFLLQFFPLTIFLKVAFLHGQPQATDWLNAFVWGGSAAVLQLVFSMLIAQGKPLNRIMLGVNWYLIVGAAAVMSNQTALLALFNNLKESGIFLCLLMVGICTTFGSKAGFVGVPATAEAFETSVRRDIRTYSIWLIVIACIGLVLSFCFRGQIIISAAAPLVFLSVAIRLLQRHLQHN
ncbi:MAG: hypothetical protein Q4G13_00790 [Moraxella sp.]|nr:hypothetical protein [Moraxella sp.]